MPTTPAAVLPVDDVNQVTLGGQDHDGSDPACPAFGGDQVVALGVSVRRPMGGVDALPVQVGPAPPIGIRPRSGQIGRRVLAAADRLEVGQRIEIRGRIQRRWWEAGGGRRSRIEVVATSIERVPGD